jgi:hypothetical protein
MVMGYGNGNDETNKNPKHPARQNDRLGGVANHETGKCRGRRNPGGGFEREKAWGKEGRDRVCGWFEKRLAVKTGSWSLEEIVSHIWEMEVN